MKSVRFMCLSVLLALAPMGCTTIPGPAGESPGDFTIEYAQEYGGILRSASQVTIARATAITEGNELVVTGTLRRPRRVRFPGYIHLVVLSPAGEPLLEKKQRMSALWSRGKGEFTVPFRIRLGFLPPKGSILRLRYQAPGAVDGNAHNLQKGGRSFT